MMRSSMLADSSISILLLVLWAVIVIAISVASKALAKQRQQNRTAQNQPPRPSGRPTAKDARRAKSGTRKPPRLPAPIPQAARAFVPPISIKPTPAPIRRQPLPPLRLTPQTLRQQYILIELLGPPVALREDSKP